MEDESGRRLADDLEPRRRAARGDTFVQRVVARAADGHRRVLEARASPIAANEVEQGASLLVLRELSGRSS
jgi:hypothetical protein